jgi:signal transduction histidine kinase
LIEQQSDGLLCAILLAEPNDQRFRVGAAPSLPAEFTRGLEAVPVEANKEACVTAAFEQETMLPDISTAPVAGAAHEVGIAPGLRSCGSTPFFSASGRLLGTIVIYAPSPHTPSEDDLCLVEQAASVTGLVVERAKIEQDRARLAEEASAKHATLSAVLESMSDGLVTLDSSGNIGYCNGRAGELLGFEPDALIGQDARSLFSVMERSLARQTDVWSTARRAMAHLDDQPGFDVVTAPPGQRDIAVQFFPAFDGRHQLVGTGILLRDVTQSRRLAMLQDRERIAMDLHDGIVQSLYGLALSLGARDRSMPEHWTETRSLLNQTIGQINMIIRDVRQYIRTLQPEPITEQDLRSGLAALMDELRLNGLLCPDVELDPAAEALLDAEATGHLLYIAHEATSNIIRHAAASAATVRLVRSEGHALLTITDNGRGFDPHRTGRRTGDGLRNMAERAAALGGRFTVQSEPGRGTEVRVQLPLPAPPEAS